MAAIAGRDDAVTCLASRAVNVLVEAPGSNGAFQLAMSATTARKRIVALARFFDSPANTSAFVNAASRS